MKTQFNVQGFRDVQDVRFSSCYDHLAVGPLHCTREYTAKLAPGASQDEVRPDPEVIRKVMKPSEYILFLFECEALTIILFLFCLPIKMSVAGFWKRIISLSVKENPKHS